jgi:hypothetical protein
MNRRHVFAASSALLVLVCGQLYGQDRAGAGGSKGPAVGAGASVEGRVDAAQGNLESGARGNLQGSARGNLPAPPTAAAAQGNLQGHTQGAVQAPNAIDNRMDRGQTRIGAETQGAFQSGAQGNPSSIQGNRQYSAGYGSYQGNAGMNINTFTDNRPDQWRYKWDNGRWWYWSPDNRWMWYDGAQWTYYDPNAANTTYYQSTPGYTTYYGGYDYSPQYYGYGYGYPYRGYYGGYGPYYGGRYGGYGYGNGVWIGTDGVGVGVGGGWGRGGWGRGGRR